jgi:hypothetical protein
MLVMQQGYGEDAVLQNLYLYTHWAGHRWPEELRSALVFGRDRWRDDAYLARIIVSRVYMGVHDDTVGGGLSFEICDNEYPITVCDLVNLTVSFASAGSEGDPAKRYGSMSFSDYVAQSAANYPPAD